RRVETEEVRPAAALWSRRGRWSGRVRWRGRGLCAGSGCRLRSLRSWLVRRARRLVLVDLWTARHRGPARRRGRDRHGDRDPIPGRGAGRQGPRPAHATRGLPDVRRLWLRPTGDVLDVPRLPGARAGLVPRDTVSAAEAE